MNDARRNGETMRRRLRGMLLILVVFVASLSVGEFVYIQHPKFGKLPEGDRRELIKRSPNYADGEFRNLIATPMFPGTNGTNRSSALLPRRRGGRTYC